MSKKDSKISIANAVHLNTPSPTFATWGTTWPYCIDPTLSCGFSSTEGLKYKAPAFDQPLLFFYGTMQAGKPRPSNFYFFGAGWIEQVERIPHVEVIAVPSDHWMHVWNASTVNADIDGWLGSLSHDP